MEAGDPVIRIRRNDGLVELALLIYVQKERLMCELEKHMYIRDFKAIERNGL